MNYETHLLKLIETRNKREHLFRDIIQDYNKLYQEYRDVTKKAEKLENQYEELKMDRSFQIGMGVHLPGISGSGFTRPNGLVSTFATH